MQLAFHTLDVFTADRFSGNPLAVVLGADDLDTQTMLQIAREFNLSETVFVQRPDNPAHNARLRIFTPTKELPFAGHPSIGTAVLLAQLRADETGAHGDALVILEEQIGCVRAGVIHAGDGTTFAEFDAPVLPAERPAAITDSEIALALGLDGNEIGLANHRITCFGAGVDFVFVPVASRDALARAAPELSHWRHTSVTARLGVFVYTTQTERHDSQFRARMFAPLKGIHEDPATGAAAAAFAGVVKKFDAPPDGMHKLQIEQGFEMGRPSLISLALEIANARLTAVRIGGHAVRVSTGQLTV